MVEFIHNFSDYRIQSSLPQFSTIHYVMLLHIPSTSVYYTHNTFKTPAGHFVFYSCTHLFLQIFGFLTDNRLFQTVTNSLYHVYLFSNFCLLPQGPPPLLSVEVNSLKNAVLQFTWSNRPPIIVLNIMLTSTVSLMVISPYDFN